MGVSVGDSVGDSVGGTEAVEDGVLVGMLKVTTTADGVGVSIVGAVDVGNGVAVAGSTMVGVNVGLSVGVTGATVSVTAADCSDSARMVIGAVAVVSLSRPSANALMPAPRMTTSNAAMSNMPTQLIPSGKPPSGLPLLLSGYPIRDRG